MMKEISGIFAPITTPFVNEDVSYDHLKKNISKYKTTPLAGFFALGSNGENKSLTEVEKLKIIEIVLNNKAENQLVMAGVGYESTKQTIEFSKKVISMGADFVSVLPPSYFKKRLTDDALSRYFTDVAEAVTVPVLAYNAPGFTGVTLSIKVVEKISQHANIVGMKDTSSGNMSSYLAVCGEGFDILSGTIHNLFSDLMLGASGGVVSLANAFPEKCCALFDLCQNGQLVEAKEIHFRLFKLNRSVSGSFGVAGVKYAMELGGYVGGDPRLPLLPLSKDDKKLIRKAVLASGIKDRK